MKKLLLLIAIVASGMLAEAQMFTGYQYLMDLNKHYPFEYTRKYTEGNGVFTTVYKIYWDGEHIQNVTATHYKSKKTVKVIIIEVGDGVFGFVTKEETTYDTPSLNGFGITGIARQLEGSRVPNQLMVTFLSEKYENVKVFQIKATPASAKSVGFYTFDPE